MDLMMMQIESGDEFKIMARGDDEREAIDSLEKVIREAATVQALRYTNARTALSRWGTE